LGLPCQTQEDLINDIILAKGFKPDMYSFGPLIPHPHTPLADEKPIDTEEMLKFIAILRLVDPNGKILVTTALETLSPSARRRALLSGANSFMLNITPARYKKLYDIYPNRATAKVSIEEQIKEALDLLKSLGRAPTDLGV
jgi:biotin synthase